MRWLAFGEAIWTTLVQVYPVFVTGPAVKYTDSPTVAPSPPPTLGQHTDSVLHDLLGYSQDSIDSLRQSGAVQWPTPSSELRHPVFLLVIPVVLPVMKLLMLLASGPTCYASSPTGNETVNVISRWSYL